MSDSKDSLRATLDAYCLPLIITASGLIISVLASFPLLYYPATADAERKESTRARLSADLLLHLRTAVDMSTLWQSLATGNELQVGDAAVDRMLTRNSAISAIRMTRRDQPGQQVLSLGDASAGRHCESTYTGADITVTHRDGQPLGCWYFRGSDVADAVTIAYQLAPSIQILHDAQLNFALWKRGDPWDNPIFLDAAGGGIAGRSIRAHSTARHALPAPFDAFEFSIWTVPRLAFSEYVAAWLVLLLGLAITGSLGAYTFRQAHRHALLVRREREQAVELSRSNEELEKFAAAASHDLHAPLRTVDTLIDFVLEDEQGNLQEVSVKNLGNAQTRIARMQALLNGLLEYARLRREEHDDVDDVAVEDVVNDALQLLDVREGISVTVLPRLPVLRTANAPLSLIFRNLLANAIKFIGAGNGRIIVGGEKTPTGGQFWVADNGPGISDANKTRVFEIFRCAHTAAEGAGNGLGLAMVQRLVRLHGGEVWVEDTPGGGCTMRFTWHTNGQPSDPARPGYAR